jgi:hypothetical protein
MAKRCKCVKAQWSTECLQLAMFAAASRIHGIPHMTLRDWVSRVRSLKKPGGNAILPAGVGKQIHQRIVHLQQVGFWVTRNHVCMFAVEICKEQSIQNLWKGGMSGKDWFICFLRRNPGLTSRKAENLSYGRLMGFSREIVDDFCKLLRKTMYAIELHQRTHLIYNLVETGLQFTCKSGNQKVLAVEGSKTVHIATTREKGDTVTVVFSA